MLGYVLGVRITFLSMNILSLSHLFADQHTLWQSYDDDILSALLSVLDLVKSCRVM